MMQVKAAKYFFLFLKKEMDRLNLSFIFNTIDKKLMAV